MVTRWFAWGSLDLDLDLDLILILPLSSLPPLGPAMVYARSSSSSLPRMSKLSESSNEKAVDRYDDDVGGGGEKEEEEEVEEEEKYSKADGGVEGSSKLTLLPTLTLSLGIAFGIGIGEDGPSLGEAVLDPPVPVRGGDRALTTSKKRFGSLW